MLIPEMESMKSFPSLNKHVSVDPQSSCLSSPHGTLLYFEFRGSSFLNKSVRIIVTTNPAVKGAKQAMLVTRMGSRRGTLACRDHLRDLGQLGLQQKITGGKRCLTLGSHVAVLDRRSKLLDKPKGLLTCQSLVLHHDLLSSARSPRLKSQYLHRELEETVSIYLFYEC